MQKAVEIIKKNLRPTFTKKQRIIFFAVSFIAFAQFVLLTLMVRADMLRSFDFDTTVRLQDDIPVKYDEFFSFLSVIGRFEFSIVTLLLILFLKRKIMGIVPFALFGIAHVIEIIGKTILSQPGPPHMFLRTTDFSTNFPGLHVHTDASYPSGHSLRAIFLSVIIIFIIWKMKKFPTFLRFGIIALVSSYGFLMLLSRVSLGEHWTTDVLAGGLLGLSFAFLSLFFI